MTTQTRKPKTVHVVDVTHNKKRQTYIATNAAHLSQQIKASFPSLPASLLDNLSKLTTEHRAKIEIPNMLTMRHADTLTTAPSSHAKGQEDAHPHHVPQPVQQGQEEQEEGRESLF